MPLAVRGESPAWHRDWVMRPSDKARRGRIPAVCGRGVTPAGGMQRRSNAAGLSPRAARPNVVMRPASADDLPHLNDVRQAAFAPVFALFRSILGEGIYRLVQSREDDAHGELLVSLLAPESGWKVYAAEMDSTVVGFVSIQLSRDTHVGEIGLNAVHPDHAGKGVGTTMYDFALARMKEAGMQVATVATGADPSHAPARRAYEKAGFTVQIQSVWLYRKL